MVNKCVKCRKECPKKNKRFCSRECYLSDPEVCVSKGKDNPKYIERRKSNCLNCGDEFESHRSAKRKFCCLKCYHKYPKSKKTKRKLREKSSGENNSFYGEKHSEKAKEKMRLSWKENPERKEDLSKKSIGEKNHCWKGDKVGYASLHRWVQRHKPKPEFCEDCKKNKPYDLANISGEYKRDVDDFEWLCRKCHMKKDGRRMDKIMEELKTCYVEQFGYDLIIGLCHGLNLGTILRLEKIKEEIKDV